MLDCTLCAISKRLTFLPLEDFLLTLTLMEVLLPPGKVKCISYKSTSRNYLYGNFI